MEKGLSLKMQLYFNYDDSPILHQIHVFTRFGHYEIYLDSLFYCSADTLLEALTEVNELTERK